MTIDEPHDYRRHLFDKNPVADRREKHWKDTK